MNKRLRKKADRRKRELIHELLDLVMDINGMEPRDRERTGNLPTAFFEFSGHIGAVDTRVYMNGWCTNAYECECRNLWLHIGDRKELIDGVQKLMAVKTETPAAGTAGGGVKVTKNNFTPLLYREFWRNARC